MVHELKSPKVLADATVGIGLGWVGEIPLTELKIKDFHFLFLGKY